MAGNKVLFSAPKWHALNDLYIHAWNCGLKTTYYLHKKYEVLDVDVKEDLEQMKRLMKIQKLYV